MCDLFGFTPSNTLNSVNFDIFKLSLRNKVLMIKKVVLSIVMLDNIVFLHFFARNYFLLFV